MQESACSQRRWSDRNVMMESLLCFGCYNTSQKYIDDTQLSITEPGVQQEQHL